MTSLDCEAIFNDVRAMRSCVLQHATKIDLVEAAFFHPLQDMGAQLELPVPPLRPFVFRQTTSESATRSCSFCLDRMTSAIHG